MKNWSTLLPLALFPIILALGSCTSPSTLEQENDRAARDAITSAEATILDFSFTADVIGNANASARDAVISQLLYAQGTLKNGSNASGQIGNVALSDVVESQQGDKKRISYRASLPVAWPTGESAPSSYTLTLPRDATALADFNTKYDGHCGSRSAEERDFWHDFNPSADGCSIDDADVARASVAVGPHAKDSEKYPEYDRIWGDGRLDVVAIFGIIRDRDPNDWGFTEAHRFVGEAREPLDDARVVDNGAGSSILEDKTISGTVYTGGRPRDVKVDMLVVDSIEDAGADFDARFDALSEKADLVLYSGHARHGRNINALIRKGKVVPGKYQLMLLNGCESFAQADTTVTDRRREANGSADPNGTRFVDVVANAQPGQSDTLASVSRVVYDAIVRPDQPMTYDAILRQMPERNVVVVYGEEDNTFRP